MISGDWVADKSRRHILFSFLSNPLSLFLSIHHALAALSFFLCTFLSSSKMCRRLGTGLLWQTSWVEWPASRIQSKQNFMAHRVCVSAHASGCVYAWARWLVRVYACMRVCRLFAFFSFVCSLSDVDDLPVSSGENWAQLSPLWSYFHLTQFYVRRRKSSPPLTLLLHLQTEITHLAPSILSSLLSSFSHTHTHTYTLYTQVYHTHTHTHIHRQKRA